MTPSVTSSSRDDSTSTKHSNQNLRDTANGIASEAKSDLRETANKMGGKVRDFVDNANGELTTVTKAVNAHIQQNPLQSSLIALGVGYLLAALIRR